MKKNMVLFASLVTGTLVVGLTIWGRETPPEATATSRMPAATLRSEGKVVAYPGSDISVGTDLGGTLTDVFVKEGDEVKKGQLLALIDSRQEVAALHEAQSRMRESLAEANFLETELNRAEHLYGSGIISRQSLDQARTQHMLSRARSEAAHATARRLKVVLIKHQIRAPIEGKVALRLAQPGETVAPGAKLLQIIQTNRMRVDAEVDEFDLTRLRLGMPVALRAEGCEEQWTGRVEEIPDQVVGRRLKPQDPARASDTRVLLVKVAFDGPTPLKLGQRVELEIDTGQ